ncbi:hypothetical protein [uncultured Draconibacterium sp.]|uniref:hypothetical protein n=1 Tax=uncultured Draconibacterium sp. TaxID=1573823 RepID=UPI003216A6F1
MYNDKLNRFLNGQLDLKEFGKTVQENTEEQEFLDSYLKANIRLQKEIPDFNPFEKVELYKKQRHSLARRILPYAASVLVIISLFFTLFIQSHKKTQLTISEQDLAELKHNTELALWNLSNELNTCLAKLEEANKISHPIEESQSLKNVNINFNNPISNLKIN